MVTTNIKVGDLGKLWDTVLEAPNVKGDPKQVKLTNVVSAVLKQTGVERKTNPTHQETENEELSVMRSVVQSFRNEKEKNLKLAKFAERLLNMSQFQKKISYKERLAVRNARDVLRGTFLRRVKVIGNALYELGISLKRTFKGGAKPVLFTFPASWRYNVKMRSGLHKLLDSNIDFTNLSPEQLKDKLKEFFPLLRVDASKSAIQKVDTKVLRFRERLFKVMTSPAKDQIKEFEKFGRDIENKKS